MCVVSEASIYSPWLDSRSPRPFLPRGLWPPGPALCEDGKEALLVCLEDKLLKLEKPSMS